MSIEAIAAKTLGVKGLENIQPSDFETWHNLTRQQIRAALRAAHNEGYDLAEERGRNASCELEREAEALAEQVNDMMAAQEPPMELFYAVKDHLRGCGDPHKFKRAFDRVQAELNEPMMHVA